MTMEKIRQARISQNEEIDILSLLHLLYAKKLVIIITTLVFSLLSFLYATTRQPVYDASILIQVEKNAQSNLISKFISPLELDSPSIATEIGILKSRRVLNQTIADLGLQIEVAEKKTPVISPFLSLFQSPSENYIDVTQFDLLPEYEDTSWTLTVLSADSYKLSLKGAISVAGKVNHVVNGKGVAINVKEIHAAEGTKFEIKKHSLFNVTRDLLKHLNAVEQAKDSGLLFVSLTGHDKQENIRILNSISLNYMKDNIATKAKETSKTLAFVDTLLPVAQTRLREADRKLHEFMQSNGAVDLPLEAKNTLESLVALQAQHSELELAIIEVSKHYTKAHPLYRSLTEKEALLEKEKRELNKQIAGIPKIQQDYLGIKRDVEAEQEIYMQLLSKQQELRITQASTVASVRIVDEAVSDPLPVGNKKGLILLLGSMAGLIVSSGGCLLMNILQAPLEEAKSIEQRGVNVLASIPLSKWLHAKTRYLKKGEHPGRDDWLSKAHPEDLSIEALRSLRTAIFISLTRKKAKNSILISSATPGAGKTFISSNLAAVMADAGKRILLIDADLRRGYLHELLGMSKACGLTDILKGSMEAMKAIQQTGHAGLDFISTGEIYQHSSELLLSQHFTSLLEWAQRQYDYVIIDTPPILPITDAAIVAQHVGLCLLVLRYRTNNEKDMDIALSRFSKCNIELDGVVFNAVQEGSPSAYGYSYYSTSL